MLDRASLNLAGIIAQVAQKSQTVNRDLLAVIILLGESIYPDINTIERELRELCSSVQIINATQLAIEAGNPQAANITLMGALTTLPQIPLSDNDYTDILKTRFNGTVLELNQKVFFLGYSLL
ncbi:MAG: 2-oxoacid:acceptor oxidoreductase family protein [Anaerohalosphaeraceae bacterium]